MKYDTATPYTASYVLLRCEGKLAFVLRSGTTWMNGYYGLPSGKVEVGESFVAAAIREAKEEVGIDIRVDNVKHVLTMHRKGGDENDNVWVDVYFIAHNWSGEPYNAEPDKHSELVWFDESALPKNVIPSVTVALHAIKDGQFYSEYGWQ